MHRTITTLAHIFLWAMQIWDGDHPLEIPHCTALYDISPFPKFGHITYRVIHLPLDLGWVDLDLGCSTILLGQ